MGRDEVTTMVNDSRLLFSNYTSRKAESWKAVRSLDPSPMQRQALAAMPVVMAKRTPCTIDDRLTGAKEFIVIFNKEFYYVNTEGYDYARYAVRLLNFAPEIAI